MSVVLVTGSAGLIGSWTARRFAAEGLEIVGIDNNMREAFFGAEASTAYSRQQLEATCPHYVHFDRDIRDKAAMEEIFKRYGTNISAIIHTAAQPSHDWAVRDPHTDFSVNALGTLTLLDLCHTYAPEAVFIFTSTNKVYGDRPNHLQLVEQATRWELAPTEVYAEHGFDEDFSIDQTLHSLFGASKVAADVLVQEYGRYFGMKTAVFRGGCLTGPGHAGTELHGFLAYLMQCTLMGKPYKINGYKGKQVRDNIHATDPVDAFWSFYAEPRSGVVYNMGGGRKVNCSMIEAIAKCEEITGRKLDVTYVDEARIGDHIWWLSDTRRFERDYPNWRRKHDLDAILTQIADALRERYKI